MATKTHETFVDEIATKNPNIEILGVYIDSKTKVEVKCLKCGNIWYAEPTSLSRGNGCPKCKHNGVYAMTDSEFTIKFEKLDSDYIKIGKYEKTDVPIEVECRFCHERKYIQPRYLLRNCKCNRCTGIHKYRSKEEIKSIIEKQYEIIDDFNSTRDKIHIKCKKCGNVTERAVRTLMTSSMCRKCWGIQFGNNQRLTNEGFIEKLLRVNSNIDVTEDYIDNKTKLKCVCKKCSNEWYASPGQLLSGSGCPRCSSSKGEIKIENFLYHNNICYETQKKYNTLFGIGGRHLRYDFYLPDYNLLIEYQGEFHDGIDNDFVKKNIDRTTEHDKRKKEYAENNNINFLEIWYWDYKNIEDILESRLLNKSA